MKQTEISIPANQVRPLTINGLDGRVLKIKSKKTKFNKRDILVIYGHHSSLERMYSIAQNVAEFGNVTTPDLPGFGGMGSFYKLGKKPTLDNYADYLATFIKLKYKKNRISIFGMSFGFVVITKMLQKYPEIAEKVDILVSLVGFTSKDDFKFSKKTWLALRYGSAIAAQPVPAFLVRYIALNPLFIRLAYKSVASTHSKMKDADKAELNRRINFEIYLWHCNHVRTYMFTTKVMMTLTINNAKVKHDLLHVGASADQYFNHAMVNKNLRRVYTNVEVIKATLANHAPTVISNHEDAKDFIPKDLRKKLSKLK